MDEGIWSREMSSLWHKGDLKSPLLVINSLSTSGGSARKERYFRFFIVVFCRDFVGV